MTASDIRMIMRERNFISKNFLILGLLAAQKSPTMPLIIVTFAISQISLHQTWKKSNQVCYLMSHKCQNCLFYIYIYVLIKWLGEKYNYENTSLCLFYLKINIFKIYYIYIFNYFLDYYHSFLIYRKLPKNYYS